MLVTWNPEKWAWDPDEQAEEIAATESGGIVRGQWSTGSRRGGVEPGDRVFLLMQGDGPRGIIGSGTSASRIFQDGHWDQDRSGEQANYALIDWRATDVCRPASQEAVSNTVATQEINQPTLTSEARVLVRD